MDCILLQVLLQKSFLKQNRNIKIPVLRWPGGCFADEYHWKDGIGNLRDWLEKKVTTISINPEKLGTLVTDVMIDFWRTKI